MRAFEMWTVSANGVVCIALSRRGGKEIRNEGKGWFEGGIGVWESGDAERIGGLMLLMG